MWHARCLGHTVACEWHTLMNLLYKPPILHCSCCPPKYLLQFPQGLHTCVPWLALPSNKYRTSRSCQHNSKSMLNAPTTPTKPATMRLHSLTAPPGACAALRLASLNAMPGFHSTSQRLQQAQRWGLGTSVTLRVPRLQHGQRWVLGRASGCHACSRRSAGGWPLTSCLRAACAAARPPTR